MLPPDLRESVQQGLKMHASYKTSLIAKLKANKNNKFPEDVLKTYDISTLENLVALAGEPDPVFNYAGMGGGTDALHAHGSQGLRDQAGNDSDQVNAPPPPRLGIVANNQQPGVLQPGDRADKAA
jgi:hypothetical protein